MISDEPLFSRLLSISPFSRKELTALIKTAPSRYKDHYIKKRNGRGVRLISQPTAELKFLQRHLVKEELSGLPIHSAAVAYRRAMSISDHATPHAHHRYLLKLDFKDFFPSLTASSFTKLLASEGRYTEGELSILRLLLFKYGIFGDLRLSIGAPSSPFISNYMMFTFDSRVAQLCSVQNAVYTRYADDLAISTSIPGVLDQIFADIKNLLDELRFLGLTLNDTKTVNVSTKNRRSLVGLTLANDGNVSVGRDKKRRLRATMHAISLNRLGPTEISRFRGELAFLLSIDRQFVKSLLARYRKKSLNDITSPQGSATSKDDS